MVTRELVTVKPFYTHILNLSYVVGNRQILHSIIGKEIFLKSSEFTPKLKNGRKSRVLEREASFLSQGFTGLEQELLYNSPESVEQGLFMLFELPDILKQNSQSYFWNDFKRYFNKQPSRLWSTDFFVNLGSHVQEELTSQQPYCLTPATIDLQYEDKYRNRTFQTLQNEMLMINKILTNRIL